MKVLDSMARTMVLARGTPRRWLREQLELRGVTVPLTAGCMTELVEEADRCVRQAGGDQPYVERLRAQLALQAEFVERWTASDEKLELAEDAAVQGLVRIARQHALPRPWKLT